MTEEQLKGLADLSLSTNALLNQVVIALVAIYEKVLPLIPEEQRGHVIPFLHRLGQIEAVCARQQEIASRARAEFGLPPLAEGP